MGFDEFNDFIQESKEEFKKYLEDVGDRYGEKMKHLLRRMLDKCCSRFEEETLTENLKQVFSEYLEENAIGE